jgi:hypothetical protein
MLEGEWNSSKCLSIDDDNDCRHCHHHHHFHSQNKLQEAMTSASILAAQ